MHIGVFTARDLNTVGGSLVRIVGITRHLSELGCRVTLFAPNLTPQLEGKVNFVPLPRRLGYRSSLFYAAFPRLLASLKYAPADQVLVNLLNEQNLDLIHCHQHDAGFGILRLRDRLKAPVVFEIHGIIKLQQDDLNAAAPFPFHLPVLLQAERNLFKQMPAIFVRTASERDYVAREFSVSLEKIYVVPDGADVDFLGQSVGEEEKRALREKLGLNGKKVILFAGWFKMPSGVLDLLKAFQLLSANRNDLVLIMAGDGILMPQVKAFVHENGLLNVLLPGFISREQFRLYQQITDVVVTPEIKSFFNELGAPLKLFECLASGRPTVATRIASHTSIVEEGVNGFLVEPEDPTDMARGLQLALEHPCAQEVGRRGRQTMIDRHSWRQSSQSALNAYAEVLARTERLSGGSQ